MPGVGAGGPRGGRRARRADHPRAGRAPGQPRPTTRSSSWPTTTGRSRSPRTSTPTASAPRSGTACCASRSPSRRGAAQEDPRPHRVSQESLYGHHRQGRSAAAVARRASDGRPRAPRRSRSATTSTAGSSDSSTSPWDFRTLAQFRGTRPSDVRETDDEVVVTRRSPGARSRRPRLAVTPDGLTIRGENARRRRTSARTTGSRAPLRELRPDRAAAARTRPGPGRGARQARRADGQDSRRWHAPAAGIASRPDQRRHRRRTPAEDRHGQGDRHRPRHHQLGRRGDGGGRAPSSSPTRRGAA